MAFIEGASLQDLIADGTVLAGRDAADLVRRVAEAIHYAHTNGVIHRDLKPGNILLAPSHREDALRLSSPHDRPVEPKITDFGLGKTTQGDSELTGTGQILGTPSYMSPEQAAGRTEEIGPLADVYSLGALLYCLLAGRPPFRAASALETLKQVVDDSPVPLRRVNSAISRDLETICHKCLEKSPQRRYTSALALADDLRRFRNGEPITARPASSLEKAAKWIRRHPASAALIAFGLLTLMALAGLLVSLQYRGELERLLYSRRVLLAHQAWQDNDYMVARQLLEACPEPLRGWEWGYVDRLCSGGLLRTLSMPGNVPGRSFTMNEKQWYVRVWNTANGHLRAELPLPNAQAVGLEFTSDSRTLTAVTSTLPEMYSAWDRMPSDQRVELPEGTEFVQQRTWSLRDSQPVGEPTEATSSLLLAPRIAYNDDGTLVAVQMTSFYDGRRYRDQDLRNVVIAAMAASSDRSPADDSEANINVLTSAVQAHHGADVNALAFSPDRQRLATGGETGIVTLWDVPACKPIFGCEGHVLPLSALVFSPDGRRLASGDTMGVVRLWDVATGRPILILSGRDAHSRAVYGLAFHPRGDQLASEGADLAVKLWDVGSDRESATLKGHQSPALTMAFAPQGRWLAAGGEDGRITLWRTDTHRLVGEVPAHAGPITSLAFRPDGRLLASASHDRTVKLWEVHFEETEKLPARAEVRKELKNLSEQRTLSGHEGTVYGVSFSPDGQTLLSAGHDGRSLIWNVATGEQEHQHRHSAGPMYCTAIDPQGARVAIGGYELAISSLGLEEMTLLEDDQQREVLSVAFSPDGRRLAAAGRDGAVRIWNAASGRLVALMPRHHLRVTSLAYSPAGDRIASASWDGSIIVWDPESGQDTLILKCPNGRVHDVAFSPDGRLLATANQDGTITLWGR
jgi:WD40 repeat protein